MKAFVALGLVLVLSAPSLKPNPADPHPLVGTWKVDLRPTPDAAPYYQMMEIRTVESGSLTGKFYQSDIMFGRINAEWGSIQFGFVTADAGANYATTGQLVSEDRIEGRTYSPERSLLQPWTAQRIK